MIRRTYRVGKTGDQTDRQARDDRRLDGQTGEGRRVIRWTDKRGKTDEGRLKEISKVQLICAENKFYMILR